MRSALKKWIEDKSVKLCDGSHLIESIPGVPFNFLARKSCTGKSGLFLSRFAPENFDFQCRLRHQLDRKVAKLSPYKNEGRTTILLVESDDIAFMDEGVMCDNLRKSYPEGLPSGIDRVWFVHTSIPEDVLFFEMTDALKK